ncbi:MAG: hypothetical protein P0Y64_14090 [Candidatus Sphingomonas colombiensis]|nr:hypothetical protein [Sphingomonas sp.]WEK42511.1 MAG: hypothetical protein P0Y64_14090 [Sphingomonas sp.]
MRLIVPVTLVASGLATACTPFDTTLGNAVKTNYALQTINPDPRPGTADPAVMEGGSGTHAAGAIERYRKGAVKQPQSMQTGRSSSSGAASGGAAPNPGTN